MGYIVFREMGSKMDEVKFEPDAEIERKGRFAKVLLIEYLPFY